MNRIVEESWQGTTVYTLSNGQLTASLCPALGNNLYRIRDEAKQREVLRVPSEPAALVEKPGHFGTPMMMPPGRIRHGQFTYGGKTYQFQKNTPDGLHHIHGFLRSKPWKMTGSSTEGNVLRIKTEYEVADFPDVWEQYPHDLLFANTYELNGMTVVQRTEVTNRGETAAPLGFGLHTWFMLDGEPEKWTLTLPTEDVWESDEHIIATGNRLPLGPYAALNTGLDLQGANFDNCFRIGNSSHTAVLAREDCELRYTSSELYKHWVIYTMGVADEIICLEPVSWLANSPNLEADPELTGLRSVAPGETLSFTATLDIVHK